MGVREDPIVLHTSYQSVRINQQHKTKSNKINACCDSACTAFTQIVASCEQNSSRKRHLPKCVQSSKSSHLITHDTSNQSDSQCCLLAASLRAQHCTNSTSITNSTSTNEPSSVRMLCVAKIRHLYDRKYNMYLQEI